MQQAIQSMIDSSVTTASTQMSSITQATNVRLDSLEVKMNVVDESSQAADMAFETHLSNIHVSDTALRAASDECQLSILRTDEIIKTMQNDIGALKKASDSNTGSSRSVNTAIDNVTNLMSQLQARLSTLEGASTPSGGPTLEDFRLQANRLEHEAVVSAKSVTNIEQKVNEHYDLMSRDVQAIKTELNTQLLVVQAQVSTAITTSSAMGGSGSGGNSGGGGGRWTLDTDKRLQHVPNLTGSEPLHEVKEWFEKTIIKLESAAPGAKKVLKELMMMKVPVEMSDINSMSDTRAAHKLNCELYSWFSNVLSGKAWSHVVNIDSGEGLEAWRQLQGKLTRMGAQQVLAEHMWLHAPEPTPKKNTDIPVFINAWEKRIRELEVISARHRVSEADKHTILRKSLPVEMRKAVDQMINRDLLLEYEGLKKYVSSVGINEHMDLTTSAQPMQLCVVTAQTAVNQAAQPQEDKWTSDEWMQWTGTEAEAPPPPEHTEDSLNAMKGRKGDQKGKGSQKGGAKRGFMGNCWGCNLPGHTHRECPTNPYIPPAKGTAKGYQKGGGKGGKGGKSNLNLLGDKEKSGLSFMLSDRPGPSACLCAECVEENKPWVQVASGSKPLIVQEQLLTVHNPAKFDF